VKAANRVDNYWVVDYTRFVNLVEHFYRVSRVGRLEAIFVLAVVNIEAIYGVRLFGETTDASKK